MRCIIETPRIPIASEEETHTNTVRQQNVKIKQWKIKYVFTVVPSAVRGLGPRRPPDHPRHGTPKPSPTSSQYTKVHTELSYCQLPTLMQAMIHADFFPKKC